MCVTVTYIGPTQGKPATWSQWVAERSQRFREVAERSQRTGFRSQRGHREQDMGRRESSLGRKINPKVAMRLQYANRSQACPGEGLNSNTDGKYI